jgi:hypothetical protein
MISECYIQVTGVEDSTFMLKADFDGDDYVMLDDDITLVSEVGPNEVDNYIYSLTAV